MHSLEFTDFHKATLVNIMDDDESLKVTLDGATQFYVVVRPEGGMIATVEGICGQIDTSRASVPILAPTSQEDLDDNLVNGRVADPDPGELAEATERVRVRRERTEASLKREKETLRVERSTRVAAEKREKSKATSKSKATV
jgi:hypothetical protein